MRESGGTSVRSTNQLTPLEPASSVKNYAQIITAMTHLTDLEADEAFLLDMHQELTGTEANGVVQRYTALRNVFPQTNDMAAYTSFSEIAHLKLSLFICQRFRQKNEENQALFDEEKTDRSVFVDEIIQRFAGTETSSLKSAYKSHLEELISYPDLTDTEQRRRDIGCAGALSAQTTLM